MFRKFLFPLHTNKQFKRVSKIIILLSIIFTSINKKFLFDIY